MDFSRSRRGKTGFVFRRRRKGKNWLQISFVNCFAIPNRRLLAKKVGWDWSGVWRIVAENQNKIPPARERSERVPSSENSQCLTWSGRRDSNPESPAPKAGMLAVTLQPASAHAFVRNPSIL